MYFELTRYVILYVATGLVALGVMVLAFQARERFGGRTIEWMLAAVAWWSLVGAIELGVVGVEAKVFWSQVTYVGPLATLLALLFFALRVRGLTVWVRGPRAIALGLLPLVPFGFVVTNGYHHLVWSAYSPGPEGSNLLVYHHGPAFWLVEIGYAYGMIIVASLLLAEVAVRLSRLHRWRMVMVLLAIALPWAGNFIYIAGLSPVPLDLAPIALVASGAIFRWVLVDSRLADVVPLARLRLIERLPDAILVLDAADRIAELNPAARRWLGVAGSLPNGGDLRQLLPADSRWQALASITSNRIVEIPPAEGDGRAFEVESVELRSAAGEHEGRLLIVRDVTLRKRAEGVRLDLERRASRAEKNESLGLFAAGVAHDFNNLMSVVLGRLSLAELKLPAGSAVIDDLHAAERAGRRVAELTRQILLYAGVAHGELSEIDLSGVVLAAANEVGAQLPPKVTFELDAPDGLPPIRGNHAQLEVVCRNVLINAFEAMAGLSGKITLRVWSSDSGEEQGPVLQWEREAPAGPHVAIEIEDTGCGMDEGVRLRMFEPFFTTKLMGRGLGLAATWGIVHGHGGWIGVATALNRGTRVRIAFPTTRRAGVVTTT